MIAGDQPAIANPKQDANRVVSVSGVSNHVEIPASNQLDR
jgi:hypothetical protein